MIAAIKKIEFIKLLAFFLIIVALNSCVSYQTLFDKEYYISKSRKLYENNNKKDTIYFYFKHGKNEKLKSYIFYKPNLKYQNNYTFNYPNIHIAENNSLYFSFVNLSHIYIDGEKRENKILKKDRAFLREKKNKIYSYKSFKKHSSIDIAYFYSYNKYKTIFIIDKSETKKGEIYLKKVSFGANFPVVQ